MNTVKEKIYTYTANLGRVMVVPFMLTVSVGSTLYLRLLVNRKAKG